MDCEQFDKIVMDLLYGEADEEHSAEAKRHAERCERCASTLGDLRATRKALSVPLVEAPAGFEQHILEAARQAQQEIPWPRRIGRWVSWAGGYAMRPQLAMAALLLLMIGSSLLLIRGRPGSEQFGVVRVTEQGVPEREGAEQIITPDPAQLPPRTATGAPEPRKGSGGARGRGLPEVGKGNAEAKRPEDILADGLGPDAGDAGVNLDGQIPSPTGNRAAQQQFNNMQRPGGSGSGAPPADGYAQAMAMYRARDFANAYRAFDGIAMSGGANAPSAALYAAKAVRASSGCTNALPRFESVIARFGNAGAGIEAKWEAATCARIVGDFTRARILYRELASLASQRERAERELARISTHGTNRSASPSASAKESNKASADRDQKKKPAPPANALDSAY